MSQGDKNKTAIICLSTQDFDDLWTRKQRFMSEFARLGHKVVYVESQWHWLTYLKRFPNKWWRPFRCLSRPRETKPNLYVVTPPILLPFFQMFAPIAAINNLIVGLWLRVIVSRVNIRDPLVYTYVPYSHLAIKILGAKRVLYEKVDDLAAAKGLVRKETIEKLEKNLLKMTQLVIVTASRLKTLMQGRHGNIHVIPNACDVSHFDKVTDSGKGITPLDAIPRPRIGFVGSLAYWVDLELIAHIAHARPDWQLVFIGPVTVDTEQITSLSNVHFVGRVSYQSLPEYMAGIDVFINPYKRDDIAESCSPLKVFEYLACGKPVVSVPMPEVMRFAPTVRIARDYDEFVLQIDQLLNMSLSDHGMLSTELKSLVKDDTWSNRFDRTRDLLREVYKL